MLRSEELAPSWGWTLSGRVQSGLAQVGGAKGTKSLLAPEVGRARTHLLAVLSVAGKVPRAR